VVRPSTFHFLPSAFWTYPCLCLCLGFSQITRITPLRFTILHLSQIFLTDALTFTAVTPKSPHPPFAKGEREGIDYFSRKIILPRDRS